MGSKDGMRLTLPFMILSERGFWMCSKSKIETSFPGFALVNSSRTSSLNIFPPIVRSCELFQCI